MDCLIDICIKSERKRKINQYRYFYRIKYCLNISMHKISETLDNIDCCDELIELKENSFEKSAKKNSKSIMVIINILFSL